MGQKFGIQTGGAKKHNKGISFKSLNLNYTSRSGLHHVAGFWRGFRVCGVWTTTTTTYSSKNQFTLTLGRIVMMKTITSHSINLDNSITVCNDQMSRLHIGNFRHSLLNQLVLISVEIYKNVLFKVFLKKLNSNTMHFYNIII